jgi:hypothetical protein
MAGFVGKLDFAPIDPDNPKEDRVLESNFGFVRDDNLMILLVSGGKVDGASIPEFLWPLLGHPLEDENAVWSSPHDGGYRGYAMIIDLNSTELSAEEVLERWYELPVGSFVGHSDVDRKWWDKSMVQAMKVLKESGWKRTAAYWGVRVGGGKSYRKNDPK